MSWSPYDEAVPQPQALDHVRPVFERLRRQRGADPDRLRLVRDVVVVASSSRGGSSLLGALLRRVDGLLHLPSEMNPHVVLATLEPGRELEVLAAEVAADIGVPGDVLDPLDVEWRLAAQWPHGGEIDVRYYDVPLEGPPPEGPPSPSFVEMPPFVVARPWRRVRPDAGTLVLTTPRSSFRLDLLRALFPDARFRVLHLTRRPEAAVNGLLHRLVELLLVLGDEEHRLGVLEEVLQLGRRARRVDADGRGADALGGHVGDEPLDAVLGVDRHLVAGLDAQLDHAHGHVGGPLGVAGPGGLLPAAELLGPHGDGARLGLGPVEQDRREGPTRAGSADR